MLPSSGSAMTHLDSERQFRDEYVVPWLRERHPHADMELERWVERTGAFCDIWLDLGTHILAIEVGRKDRNIRGEAAQAQEYAAEHPDAVPVVVVPKGHREREVKHVFQERGVLVWEVPTE